MCRFTDNAVNALHNLTISLLRENAIKEPLISRDISIARLTTKGMGDTKLISENTTLKGKANNRRVAFIKL
jgi:outer membrane protein OmpA-like peptidoglycan-associated protein